MSCWRQGANLAEMTRAGMPVPQGFNSFPPRPVPNITRSAAKSTTISRLEIYEYLGKMEEICGKKFADPENPLLASVRPVRASMPGMMDTILNLGLNDVVVGGLAKFTNNPRFAYTTPIRFIQMFSDVVMELPRSVLRRSSTQSRWEKGREDGHRAWTPRI